MQYNIGIYTRLSKEDKDKNESESITNQKYIIENFINNNNEFLGAKKFNYSDDGYVGTNFNRPSFKKLIEDVKNRKINCIIVKDLSRFGRDYIEVNNYLDKIFPFLDIRFISINDNYDSSKNKNYTIDLDISFKNILYTYYSKDLSKKVKTGMIAKAKQGDYIFDLAPFGYKKNKETKRLEIDEETAPIVKMIFDLKYQNKSNLEICRILNEKNIPPKSYFKTKNQNLKMYSKINKDKIWKKNDIYRILYNEVYIGNTVLFKNKTIKCGGVKTTKSSPDEVIKIENTHTPIIEKDIFYEICLKKEKPVVKNNRAKNLFAYKLKCGCCGYSLKHNRNNKTQDKKYYCISRYETKENCCQNINIKESMLEEIVFESLKKQILLNLEKNLNVCKKDKLSLEQQLKEITLKNKEIYEEYVYKRITKNAYLKIKKENEIEEEKINEKIKKLDFNIYKNKEINDENKVFKEYINTNKLTRKMVETFIKIIYIFDENTIKIVYNF